MAQKDLIPLGQPGNEEYDKKVREKLKNSGSKKRELAQQVRRAKEKIERGDSDVDEITLLISNPDASARQIAEMIQTATKMNLKPMEFISLIRTTVEKHKALFGNKLQVDANVNINQIKYEINLTRMCEKLAEFKMIENSKPQWIKKFGQEQADEMEYALKYKYGLDAQMVREAAKRLADMLKSSGLKSEHGSELYKDVSSSPQYYEEIDDNKFSELKEHMKKNKIDVELK